MTDDRFTNLFRRAWRAHDRMDRRLTVAVVWSDLDGATRVAKRLATLRARLDRFRRSDAERVAERARQPLREARP